MITMRHRFFGRSPLLSFCISQGRRKRVVAGLEAREVVPEPVLCAARPGARPVARRDACRMFRPVCKSTSVSRAEMRRDI